MAEHRETHRAQHAPTLLPEELFPAKSAHQRDELGVVALHDRPALIEKGEQVAQPAAASVLARNRGRVHGIDARLGAREREPHERVEPVVQTLGSRRHFAALMDAQLVIGVIASRRNEAQWPPARRADAIGLAVQSVERALAVEPGAHGVEDRMR